MRRARRAELASLLAAAGKLLPEDEDASRRRLVRRRMVLTAATQPERELQSARMHSEALITDLECCGREMACERTLMVEAELEVERAMRA